MCLLLQFSGTKSIRSCVFARAFNEVIGGAKIDKKIVVLWRIQMLMMRKDANVRTLIVDVQRDNATDVWYTV